MLHIYTYGAGDLSKFKFLKESAETSDIIINYITQPKWNGYFDKILYTMNAIKDLPDNDIVAFIDGFDVLAFGYMKEIEEKFYKANCELLFGAELNCWPGEYLDIFPNLGIKNGYRYLNSGGFIGYKRAIMDLYSWKPIEEIAKMCGGYSDQGYCIEYFAANHDKRNIKLDSECQIFQNMFSVDWDEIYVRNGRLINSLLQTTPCFIHFNGNSWKTHGDDNIMPVFISQVISSKLHVNNNTILTFTNYRQNFNQWYFKREQIYPPNNKLAICILSESISPVWIDFLYSFIAYDVYIFSGDRYATLNRNLSYLGTRLKWQEISDPAIYESGIINSTYKYSLNSISPADRALYYFSNINNRYEHVWFIEDDVYFYNEDCLANIDKKFIGSDLLTGTRVGKYDDIISGNTWFWNDFSFKLPEPYFRSNTNAFRASKKLLGEIAQYAKAHRSLDLLEALLPTLASTDIMNHDIPFELQTIKESKEWNYNDLDRYCLYHPIKNSIAHKDNRIIETFNVGLE